MPLETATYIDQLVSTNPADTDNESQGAAHLRLIKSTLLTTFPNLGDAAVTATAAQLNELLTLLNAGGTIANQGLSTALVPMGTVHTFARDPGTTMVARGGTATGAEQFILLDGSSYASSKFAALAASSFVTVSGSNFSVDNLCDTGRFIRAHVPGTTTPGTTQANQNLSHTHALTDPGHTHTVTDPGHDHPITDPGHLHNITVGTVTGGSAGAFDFGNASSIFTEGAGFVANATTGITINNHTTGITNQDATTGITMATEGGAEARPEAYIGFICLKT